MKRRIIALITAITVIASLLSILPTVSADAKTVYKGCDVSAYQGNVNWTKAKNAGLDFTVLRIYCNGKDSKFDTNYSGAKNAGLKVGAYTFMYATNAAAARNEANATIAALGGKTLDYPLFLDVESSSLQSLGKSALGDLIQIELDIFRDAGYIPAIYTFASFMRSYMDISRFSDYDLWIAIWPVTKTYTSFNDVDPSSCSYDCAMWQFTDHGQGSVYGMDSEFLDLDYCYKDYNGKQYAEGYSKNSNTYVINDCDTRSGWSGDFNTDLYTQTNRRQGTGSLHMVNLKSQTQIIGQSKIGALARCRYETGMNLSVYDYIAFDFYISHSFDGYEGYLELNFCTDNVDDGFNYRHYLSGLAAGWHSVLIKRDSIPSVVSANWSKITNLRWSWWNTCSRNDNEINILLDNLRALNVGTEKPGGNILKVTYSNENPKNPGYKYLDLASSTIRTGWTLQYDVYLENNVKGIGGIELDDKYNNFARDEKGVYDQNGIASHPTSDLSKYAYKKWYHREIALPDHWNGVGYANFYSMIAFDGGFSGNATAYFDNIKLVNTNGETAEYFFLDGGDEFNYVNDATVISGPQLYSGTNYNGVNASVVSYSEIFDSDLHTVTLPVNLDNSEWSACTNKITLRNGSETFNAETDTGATRIFKVKNGTYSVFDGEEDLNKTVTVSKKDIIAPTVNYYTVTTEFCKSEYAICSVTNPATGETVADKTPVFSGKTLVYSVQSTFTKGLSFVAWSDGTYGDKFICSDLSKAPSAVLETYIWGDTDKSREVNSTDALLTLQYSANKKDLDNISKAISNVDGNTTTNSADALLILQKSAKKIPLFPVER